MIKQVSHTVAGTDAAGFALALEVAYALHPPVTRAPEVASVAVARRGVTAARSRRRTAARG
jgi:adenine/guanine phosphoribosyltransferase-like PRPP-binding protein